MASDKEEGYIEIYRYQGQENWQLLIMLMINKQYVFRSDRYDLAKVGRYKMNQRLDLETSLNKV